MNGFACFLQTRRLLLLLQSLCYTTRHAILGLEGSSCAQLFNSWGLQRVVAYSQYVHSSSPDAIQETGLSWDGGVCQREDAVTAMEY